MNHKYSISVTDKIKKYLRPHDTISKIKVYTDTSDFFQIFANDIISLGGRDYFIKGNEYEERFGLDDPKHWVKKAVDIEAGSKKIIKLVFFEVFEEKVKGITVKYARSPIKEARVLDVVTDHENFMQGFGTTDEVGNQVRIIDRIQGKTLYSHVLNSNGTHLDYFVKQVPEILKKTITCFEALSYLHQRGEKHADIRSDHIIIEQDSGVYKWIDFDMDYDFGEKPFGMDIFGVGNVIGFVIGKGIHNLVDVQDDRLYDPRIFPSLNPDDFSPIFSNRVMNLKKIFPYIPDELNNILLHFSMGTTTFYETMDEIIYDLRKYIALYH